MLLRGAGLCLGVVSSLDGVMDITVIADLVARQGMPMRKVVPSLLLRLGTLGPRLIRAVARGVATTPHRL